MCWIWCGLDLKNHHRSIVSMNLGEFFFRRCVVCLSIWLFPSFHSAIWWSLILCVEYKKKLYVTELIAHENRNGDYKFSEWLWLIRAILSHALTYRNTWPTVWLFLNFVYQNNRWFNAQRFSPNPQLIVFFVCVIFLFNFFFSFVSNHFRFSCCFSYCYMLVRLHWSVAFDDVIRRICAPPMMMRCSFIKSGKQIYERAHFSIRFILEAWFVPAVFVNWMPFNITNYTFDWFVFIHSHRIRSILFHFQLVVVHILTGRCHMCGTTIAHINC